VAGDAVRGLIEARPTISVGGRERQGLRGGLMSMVIEENTQGLYRCEAMFGNWGPKNGRTDFLYFDRQTLDFGKPIEMAWEGRTLFAGKIFAMEANFPDGMAPEITILAEDVLQDLRMTRRTRTFTDINDADVVRKIAQDHGLTPEVSIDGPTYKVLAQVNQSDLAFLRDRARLMGAELWVTDKTLSVKTRTARRGATISLAYASQLRECVVIADLAEQRTSVTVSGWDVSAKSLIKHEATESAIQPELNGDQSGISILQSSFGHRKESVAHTVPLSTREAQSEAESILRMTSRRFMRVRGVAEPDGRLRVGAYVELQRLGPLFDGKYYLSSVRHVFEGTSGMRVEFEAERPGIGRNQ
jgi:phage protein D